jgi:phosphoesterase RecJ-like protein
MSELTLHSIAELIRNQNKFILLSHTSPDGDTVGSVTALAIALQRLGKEVTCLCDSEIPPYLRFICQDLYQQDTDVSGAYVLSVDVASPQMLGKLEEKFSSRTDLRLDHHQMGTDFATLNYCEPNAAATAEIIWLLLQELQAVNALSATALYLGLSTDTGGFRFSNTTARTLRIAAELMEAGADADEVNERLYENITLDSLKTNSFFLEKAETYFNGSLLLVPYTIADREAAGLTEDQLDGLSSLARKIIGVQLGISLRQKEIGVYKASMRSRKSIDCAAICSLLGGGGHIRAAGATIHAESLEEAKKILLETITQALPNNEEFAT